MLRTFHGRGPWPGWIKGFRANSVVPAHSAFSDVRRQNLAVTGGEI